LGSINKVFCPECREYSTCVELCPDAERFASQDYKGFNSKREVLVQHDKLPFLYNYLERLGKYNDEFFVIEEGVKLTEESLELLTKSQRYVLYEFYWNGKSHRDIASMLGVKHQAVTEHLRAARKALKHLLVQKKLPFTMVEN